MTDKRMLITGGAGFIGCNAARHFGMRNWNVTVLDNLSRPGADKNLRWLRDETSFDFKLGDVRDQIAVDRVIADGRFDAVLHLAAQVAVTTSVLDPRTDFAVNALGTFNVLDAVRLYCPEAVFIFASTNKVYGKIVDAKTELRGNRYEYANRPYGIGEKESLDFLSPYGCSKGAADQYILDFARMYKISATSFRQSCIYGPRQFGVEDQGWVAWFVIASLLGRDITIYGDGKQARDILHVDDLLRAYEAAIRAPQKVLGEAFNVGGGPDRVISLIDLVGMLENRLGRKIPLRWDNWRPGDQEVYVSDTRKMQTTLDWKSEIGVTEGIGQLINWVNQNRLVFDPRSKRPDGIPQAARQEIRDQGLRPAARQGSVMRILVTGGAGFIGSHLVRRLLADGRNVSVVDNETSGNRENVPADAWYALADVTRPAEVEPAFARGLDAVCHIAGQVSILRSFTDPIADLRTNVEGTLNILQLCLKYKVPRLIYASSMTLYGDIQVAPMPETEPCWPDSYYGITKYAAERYVHATADRPDLDFDFGATSLRMFSVYGPGQRYDNPYQGVLGIFAGNLLRGEPITIFGDGEQTRDFVFIDDIVDGWIRTLDTPESRGRVINLGSGRSLSINKAAECVITAFGYSPSNYTIHRAPARPGEQRAVRADIRQAKSILHWEPSTSFEIGLAKTIRWARDEFATRQGISNLEQIAL
jgi:nucleoside-diphosphate-sugar epimerase